MRRVFALTSVRACLCVSESVSQCVCVWHIHHTRLAHSAKKEIKLPQSAIKEKQNKTKQSNPIQYNTTDFFFLSKEKSIKWKWFRTVFIPTRPLDPRSETKCPVLHLTQVWSNQFSRLELFVFCLFCLVVYFYCFTFSSIDWFGYVDRLFRSAIRFVFNPWYNPRSVWIMFFDYVTHSSVSIRVSVIVCAWLYVWLLKFSAGLKPLLDLR